MWTPNSHPASSTARPHETRAHDLEPGIFSCAPAGNDFTMIFRRALSGERQATVAVSHRRRCARPRLPDFWRGA